MARKGSMIQYYLFFCNFLTALGGGMILGKGMGIINMPLLKGGAVLAFFVGTILGLLFLHFIPKNISTILTRWFAIFGGLTSLVLFALFTSYAQHEMLDGFFGLLFFFLLSVRFGFWFYSRALRASIVANQEQSIAWVELGYYAGTILGLIFWSLPGIYLKFSEVLLIDVCLLLFAGCIDLYVSRASKFVENMKMECALEEKFRGKYLGWRLILILVFLTIGTQTTLFGLIYQVPEHTGSFIMAAFYGGVFMAALTCKKNKISLEWNNGGYAVIRANNERKATTFFLYCLITIVCVFISICIAFSRLENTPAKMISLLIFIALSSYFYEILALVILDRIGFEERFSNHSGIVMRSYGLMSLGSAIGLWYLSVIRNSFVDLCVMLGVAFFICFGTMKWISDRQFSQ